jgi:hypothetical protein
MVSNPGFDEDVFGPGQNVALLKRLLKKSRKSVR